MIEKALAPALAVFLLSGCALALQDRPSRHPAGERCSTAPWWAGDVALLTGAVGTAIAGQIIGGDAGNTMTGIAVVGAVIDMASLGNGVRWWRQCQRGPGIKDE